MTEATHDDIHAQVMGSGGLPLVGGVFSAQNPAP